MSARRGPRGVVLCVGGFDPSGGARVFADARGARAAGGRAVTILAALTAQNSARAFEAKAVPRGWVRSQIAPFEGEVVFGAVKTGLFASPDSIAELAAWYRAERGAARGIPIVVDPVFASGDGTRLAMDRVWRSLVRDLIPLASLVTPNRGEAERLSGVRITGRESMERAARRIVASRSGGPSAVLLKGGHVPGPPADLLCAGERMRWLPSAKRLPGRWHGLGCHLASMIAVRLAVGDPLPRAVVRARALLARGMRGAVVTPSGRRVPSWEPGRSRG